MKEFSFVFTILFMLIGPIKLIPTFSVLMKGADIRFKRDVAIKAALLASGLCAFVALGGGLILAKYSISLDALRIAGGLVLLIAALQVIFQKAPTPSPRPDTATAIQLAVSPVAMPMIVPPAGIAAILIGITMAQKSQVLWTVIPIALAIMMVLDLLVMLFIDRVMKTPGLMVALSLLGFVLIFVQAALAVEVILNGLKSLGVIRA
jgi:multiple antibiotic resistance protein